MDNIAAAKVRRDAHDPRLIPISRSTSRTFARSGHTAVEATTIDPSPPALALVPAPRAHPQAVSDIIRTTLGPRSMLKMILGASAVRPRRDSDPRPADRLIPAIVTDAWALFRVAMV